MILDNRRDQVVRLYEDGEFALAADLARHFLRETPDDGRLLEIYGAACCNLKAYDAAQDALETATMLVPLHPLAQFALATCYVIADKPDLAAMMFEHLVGVVRCTSMLSAIATRLGGLGRYESALEVCLKIKRIDPAHHQALFGVAYYLNHLGNPPEALIEPLAMAMDLAPHVHHYRINLAFVLADTGRVDQACELFAGVPLELINCPCVVRRIKDLFERNGDWGQSIRCQARLSCLQQ
jgi:Flp pilus assembly protein TadD